MDTSKEYILMLKEAWEIQKLCKFKDDDLIAKHEDDSCVGVRIYLLAQPVFECDIWLPRQDQLQVMMNWPEYYKIPVEQILYFNNSMQGAFQTTPYYKQFTSMEQLWLAFIMKKKYNKIWNGKEWINQKQ